MHTQDIQYWQHDHSFGQDRPHVGERRTLIVTAITLLTMVVEVAAGITFGSMALLADGIHMGTHALALGISAFAYIYARRHAHDRRFTFGTGKVNALGGYTGAIVLGVFAAIMVWESVERAMNPVPIQFDWAIVVAVAGLLVNGICMLILGGHGPGHTHSHAHSHADNEHDHHLDHDHNMRAAYLHVLVDALTSFLAIFALLVGKYFGAVWLDPAMGIVGALLVVRWARQLLGLTSGVLLDQRAALPIREALSKAIEGDADNRLADFHIWSIGPGIYSAAISVVTRKPRPPEYYKALIPTDLGVVHTTVEVQRCDSSGHEEVARPWPAVM